MRRRCAVAAAVARPSRLFCSLFFLFLRVGSSAIAERGGVATRQTSSVSCVATRIIEAKNGEAICKGLERRGIFAFPRKLMRAYYLIVASFPQCRLADTIVDASYSFDD